MSRTRHSGPFVVALFLVAGAFGACSSSSKSNGTGGATGSGGNATGTGGNATDAGSDTKTDTVVADTGSDRAIDASPATITVTSSALAEGGTFMATNTCAGVNTSPPLTWTAGPAGTMSYTVALTDKTNGAVHWIIWDIPSTTTSLAAALPAGSPLTTPANAKQVHRTQFFQAGTDYRGPCPMGALHTYEFQVNAIGTATLGGVTAGVLADPMNSDMVQGLAQGASLAHGNLTGSSSAMMPPADAGGQ
jgi:Raf kinase inhibitor-like YbhB/YbcL family protein